MMDKQELLNKIRGQMIISYFMKHSVSDDFIISWRKIFSIYYVDRKFYF